MNEDFPWLYVAMIVIAFISWILNRIQEFTNARKEAKERKERPEDVRRIRERQARTEEAWLPEEEEIQPEPRIPSPARTDPGEALRELYEALGGPPAEQAPQRPRTTPPPIRRKAKAVDAATATERKPIAIPRPSPAAQQRPEPASVRKSRNSDSQRAKLLLKSRSGLRQAMILKEIFGDPKGSW